MQFTLLLSTAKTTNNLIYNGLAKCPYSAAVLSK